MALELTEHQQRRLQNLLDRYDEDLAELSWLMDNDDDTAELTHDEPDLFSTPAAQHELELANRRDRQRRDTELATRGAKLRAWSAQYDEGVATPNERAYALAAGSDNPADVLLAHQTRHQHIDLAVPGARAAVEGRPARRVIRRIRPSAPTRLVSRCSNRSEAHDRNVEVLA